MSAKGLYDSNLLWLSHVLFFKLLSPSILDAGLLTFGNWSGGNLWFGYFADLVKIVLHLLHEAYISPRPLDAEEAENLVLLLLLDTLVDGAHDKVHFIHELVSALLILFFLQSLFEATLERTDHVSLAISLKHVLFIRIFHRLLKLYMIDPEVL